MAIIYVYDQQNIISQNQLIGPQNTYRINNLDNLDFTPSMLLKFDF